MKRLLFILLSLIICSCHSHEVEVYKEDSIIEEDTLNIEQIKIKTH